MSISTRRFLCGGRLFQRFRAEGRKAVEAYLELLRSGGSDYPLVLLARAGVDLSTPQPINDAMALFRQLLPEFIL